MGATLAARHTRVATGCSVGPKECEVEPEVGRVSVVFTARREFSKSFVDVQSSLRPS